MMITEQSNYDWLNEVSPLTSSRAAVGFSDVRGFSGVRDINITEIDSYE